MNDGVQNRPDTLDAITLEVLRNALQSVAEEMPEILSNPRKRAKGCGTDREIGFSTWITSSTYSSPG